MTGPIVTAQPPPAPHAGSRPQLLLPAALVAAAALALVAGLALSGRLPTLAPSADPGRVSVARGVSPVSSPEHVAALARAYLDAQTPEIAAPELHVVPAIVSTSAVLARDARELEPEIPDIAVAQRPDRVVWVVTADGDFLNLIPREWSAASSPEGRGTIVIDDASGQVLGVYPHAAPVTIQPVAPIGAAGL